MSTSSSSNTQPKDSNKPKLAKYEQKLGEFSDFLNALDGFAPTLPTECVEYYMKRSGVQVEDSRVTKLIALAGDRFMAKIVSDAKQDSSLRNIKSSMRKQKRKKEDKIKPVEILDMDNVNASLSNSQVHIKRKITASATAAISK